MSLYVINVLASRDLTEIADSPLQRLKAAQEHHQTNYDNQSQSN